MIENELRDKLKQVELNIFKITRKMNKSNDGIALKRLQSQLIFQNGKEEGLLEAIKILWGEDYEDKLYKEGKQ